MIYSNIIRIYIHIYSSSIFEHRDIVRVYVRSMLELGSSKPWPDAMEKISGQRQMDSAGLLEYFKPLTDWLTEENKKTNEYIGWKPTKKRTYYKYKIFHEVLLFIFYIICI